MRYLPAILLLVVIGCSGNGGEESYDLSADNTVTQAELCRILEDEWNRTQLGPAYADVRAESDLGEFLTSRLVDRPDLTVADVMEVAVDEMLATLLDGLGCFPSAREP